MIGFWFVLIWPDFCRPPPARFQDSIFIKIHWAAETITTKSIFAFHLYSRASLSRSGMMLVSRVQFSLDTLCGECLLSRVANFVAALALFATTITIAVVYRRVAASLSNEIDCLFLLAYHQHILTGSCELLCHCWGSSATTTAVVMLLTALLCAPVFHSFLHPKQEVIGSLET